MPMRLEAKISSLSLQLKHIVNILTTKGKLFPAAQAWSSAMKSSLQADAKVLVDEKVDWMRAYTDKALDSLHTVMQMVHSRDKSRAEPMQIMADEIQQLKNRGVAKAQD